MAISPANSQPAASPQGRQVTHGRVVALAVPIMAANVSEPLIGVVDTAVVGQIGDPVYIGAIAVGALVFSFVYWGFGFLRMGTSGLAAQAHGAERSGELALVIARAIIVAGAIGVGLIVAQKPILWLALAMIDGSKGVEGEASVYFTIRIWSAPFALANYAMLGWLIGAGRTGRAMALQLVLNVTNMILDALFVLGLGMSADGVGLGTLMAEVTAALVGAGMIWRQVAGSDLSRITRHRLFDASAMRRLLTVNIDIMIRTLCLTAGFWWFTAQGAKAGDLTIAGNAVLMQFVTFSAFLIDGFAHAASALAGQAVGAARQARFAATVRLSMAWALAVGAGLSAVMFMAGGAIIDALTVNQTVRDFARVYLPWAAMTPLVGAPSFILDGVYIGAMWTRDMRNLMALVLVIFLASGYALTAWFANHGLWAAFMVFYLARAGAMAVRLPGLVRETFG